MATSSKTFTLRKRPASCMSSTLPPPPPRHPWPSEKPSREKFWLTCNDAFQFECPLAAEPKGNGAKNSEGTINQPPPKGNAAQTAKHERIRNYQRTGDQPEIKQPTVADRLPRHAPIKAIPITKCP